MIRTECPGCQRGIQAPESMAGKRVQCPACKNWLVVPGLPTPAPSQLDAPPSSPHVQAPSAPTRPVEPKQPFEHLRKVPAKAWAIGGGVLALVILIVLASGLLGSKPENPPLRQPNQVSILKKADPVQPTLKEAATVPAPAETAIQQPLAQPTEAQPVPVPLEAMALIRRSRLCC
jgi:hypothetical protein